MKLQSTEISYGKQQSRRKSPKIFPLIILTLFLTIITINYPSFTYHTINPKKVSLFSHSNFDLSVKPTSDFDREPPCDDSTPAASQLLFPAGDYPKPKISQNEASNTNPDEKIFRTTDRGRSRQREEGGGGEEEDEVVMVIGKKTDKRERKRRGRRRRRDRPKPPPPPPPPEEDDDVDEDDDGGGGGDGTRVVGLSSELLMDKEKGVEEEEEEEECNLFSGEWIPNLEAPYYTNQTCFAIQEHQNCMKFGRPDSEFLKWRWKPDECDLPVFDPHRFLKLVSGKSLAFVGDSVARNHMQSLICLLSTVAIPVTVSSPFDQNQRHEYRDYNFTMSIFWAPYLVRVVKTDANNVNLPFNLYLDEFDEEWRGKIGEYDYLIISGGQWFFRPTNFFLNRRFVGCLYCSEENVTHYGSAAFSYRRAFRTALRAIYSSENFKGLTVLRTYATSHFENGRWDAGGDCARRVPYKRKEAPPMEDYSVEMYNIQLREFQIAEREARKRGLRFKLFDATKPMFLRPDGHPSKYGHWPKQNVTLANDCVHWCLPGPIDTLNDFLLELMKRDQEKDGIQAPRNYTVI